MESVLKSCFVFNPEFQTSDATEEDKLLFYYPPDASSDQKMSAVGLSQGLINFTRQFSPDSPCESVWTEKHRHAFYQPEPDFWLAVVVSNPSRSVPQKSGKPTTKHMEDDVSDLALRNVLKTCYAMFKLFNGSFASVVARVQREGLVRQLELFLPKYLSTISFQRLDLFNTFNGIHFLPMDKNVYLRIQSFVNLTENSFSCVKHMIFLYKDLLVWSGLELTDMRVLYHCLVEYINSRGRKGQFWEAGLPASSPPADRSSPILSAAPVATTSTSSADDALGARPSASLTAHSPAVAAAAVTDDQSGFVTGMLAQHSTSQSGRSTDGASSPSAANSESGAAPYRTPSLYVGHQQDPFDMVILKHAESTVVLVLESGVTGQPNATELLTQLQNFITPELRGLTRLIVHQDPGDSAKRDDVHKFVYFNHTNLAMKMAPNVVAAELRPSILDVVQSMHEEFHKAFHSASTREGAQELCVKTQSDGWVVGRRSESREFYVLIESKNANLIEVNEDVRRVAASYFANIFIE